jgi:hypothetical protein
MGLPRLVDRGGQMTVRRALSRTSLVTAGWLIAGCSGGSEPDGTLTLTLDAFSPATTSSSVVLAGGVTRSPEKNTRIVVRVTGGLGAPADTVQGGRFSISVPLTPNATNQFSVTASDATGATSETKAVSIRQDNQAPAIAQSTPADLTDGVALNSGVQVRMSEAVVVGAGGGIRVTRQGVPIAGTGTLSGDSLTFSFTPSAPLAPNAIYRIGFSGVGDALGNMVPDASSACFVTTINGAPQSGVFPDDDNFYYQTNPAPVGLLVPDVISSRFAREGTAFSGIIQFAGTRSFSRTATDRAAVYIDLDIDQNPATGYATFKDTLGLPGVGPSGTRAEYFIALDPDAAHHDSAEVVLHTQPVEDAIEGEIVGFFMPGSCGAFMSFLIPFSAVGGDDGLMNIVMLAFSGTSTALFVDPVPGSGHFTLNLPATTAPGPLAASAFTPSSSRPPWRGAVGRRPHFTPIH